MNSLKHGYSTSQLHLSFESLFAHGTFHNVTRRTMLYGEVERKGQVEEQASLPVGGQRKRVLNIRGRNHAGTASNILPCCRSTTSSSCPEFMFVSINLAFVWKTFISRYFTV